MSSVRFDNIDMVSSTVAHSIFYSTIDREVKRAVMDKLASMVVVFPEAQMRLPTVFTDCDALANFKRELRRTITPLVVSHPLFHQAMLAMGKNFSVSEKEFTEVLTSKLFELLLAERTRKVFTVQRQRAEALGDDLVGVAFGMRKEGKADGQ